MPVKVLLLSASPHKEKSQTFLLAKGVLEGLSGTQAITSEIVHLGAMDIGFCRHCEACHKKILACPIDDDVPGLLGKMLAADGIIVASPNYINHITASMKALFDRSSHFIHCKRLLGKYVAGVVSSGSGFDKEVLDYIAYYARACGAQYSGGVSSRVPVSEEKRAEAVALGKKLAADMQAQRVYADQAEFIGKGKQHFGKIILARKDDWTQEYQYWKDREWL